MFSYHPFRWIIFPVHDIVEREQKKGDWKHMGNVRWVLALISFLAITLFSCSKPPSPHDALKTYTSYWTKQQFAKMYDMLSEETKKTVGKEQFVDRYKKIYGDIQVSHLSVAPVPVQTDKKDSDKTEISLPFSVKMDTVAGPVQFRHEAKLVKEQSNDKEQWRIKWDPSYIFPQLGPNDKVRLNITPGKRGEIIDRNGQPLAMNGTAYEIGVIPGQMGDNAETIKQKLASLLGVSPEIITEKLNAPWVRPDYFVPIQKVSKTDKRVEEARRIQAVAVKETPEREYPLGAAAAHLVGYVGTITKEEWEAKKDEGYSPTSRIGKRGLEELWEGRLRAHDGARLYIEKADGSTVTIAETKPRDGETIAVTIDAKVQQAIYREMKGRAGTAAAIHPQTGEILALVSSPSFDPNRFVLGLSSSEYAKWQNDPLRPLVNRFAATYAPGSAIKPIIAAIALEQGAITPKETKTIHGRRWQPDRSWGNYFITRVHDGPERVDLTKALVYSDNIYFAMAGLELGPERMESGLRSFGFGEKPPFPYPIPASRFSNSGSLKTGPQLADTAYGQGEMQMSILHLAAAYTPFVTGGDLLQPVLEKGQPKTVWKQGVISSQTAAIVAGDLVRVVADPNGTAHDAYIKSIPLAGKTGTAELKQEKGTQGKENGLFVAYPADRRDLLLALLIEGVENDGGSRYAVNAAKRIFTSLR
jgi:cell division protein FtsI/penicillin-binding protein 2